MALDDIEQKHWPEALVALIDALDNFIDIDRAMGDELLAQGQITPAAYRQGMNEITALQRLSRRLKSLEPDRTLDGTIGS